ncbi:MAG: hypothetical protein ABI238_03915 [Terrimesophilobacter sp.]
MSINHSIAPRRLRSATRSGPRGYIAILGTFVLAAFMAFGVGETAFAATPPTVEQCNGAATAGQEIQCDVTVVNTLNVATGVGSSVVTVKVCTGPAGAPICGASAVTNYTGVITSVNQCNNSLNDGGSWVECKVNITNKITGSGTPTPATVNQCVGTSGGGGSTLTCDPVQSTTGATFTQCNGSANGGGAKVTCTVPNTATQAAALRVTVNQCNNSANGGGSTVICSATQSNSILPAGTTRGLAYTGFNGWPTAIYGSIALLLGALLLARSRSLKKKLRNN